MMGETGVLVALVVSHPGFGGEFTTGMVYFARTEVVRSGFSETRGHGGFFLMVVGEPACGPGRAGYSGFVRGFWMGAWGYQAFDNDSAWDWCTDFREEEDKALFLERTFCPEALEGYIEVDEGAYVIAAAEMLYALLLGPRPCLPDGWKAWAKNKPVVIPRALCLRAVEALERVVGADSEVAELWEENEDMYSLWREDVAVLHGGLLALAGEEK